MEDVAIGRQDVAIGGRVERGGDRGSGDAGGFGGRVDHVPGFGGPDDLRVADTDADDLVDGVGQGEVEPVGAENVATLAHGLAEAQDDGHFVGLHREDARKDEGGQQQGPEDADEDQAAAQGLGERLTGGVVR